MLRSKLVLVLLTLLVSASSFAAPKVSLITVSPGDTLFDAFGHAAIMVEPDQAATPPPASAEVLVFEFGSVNPVQLFAGNTERGFLMLFNSLVRTQVIRTSTPLESGTKMPKKFREKYVGAGKGPREIVINRLDLTDAQADALVAGLEADYVKTLRGRYTYENYTRNCATGPRDRIFADDVLGSAARATLDAKVDISLAEVSMESIDEGIAKSDSKTVKLFDAQMAASDKGKAAINQLSWIEIPSEFKSAKELYSYLEKADSVLGGASSPLPLGRGFHKFFFAPELSEKPITEWRATYTPKRVRAVLLKTINPATGRSVISVTDEVQGNNAPAPAPVPDAAPIGQPAPTIAP